MTLRVKDPLRVANDANVGAVDLIDVGEAHSSQVVAIRRPVQAFGVIVWVATRVISKVSTVPFRQPASLFV